MIYTTDVQVPILCPIEFQEPEDLDFYPMQEKYIPKILIDTEMNVMFRVSETLYGGGNANLRLYISDVDGFVTYINANGITLSTGYYFVNFKITSTHFSYLTIDSYIKFELYSYTPPNTLDTLLADSVIYQYAPKYDKDIKQIIYSHNKNDYGLVFNKSSIEYDFKIWVESGFIPDGFGVFSEKEDFKDQFANNTIIYGMPYEKYKFTIGDNLGIPNWLARKINYVFLLDNITINKLPYTVAADTNLEKVEGTYNGLAIYSIDLQQVSDFNQKMSTTFKIHNNVFSYQFN
jgi:hypothetical protein